MSLSLLLKSGKTVFSTQEIGNILKVENKSYLLVLINRMKKRGELKQIKKGFYSITDNFNFFELANKLRTPSYISLQSILFEEKAIFQDFSNKITSVSYNTFKITILDKEFIYHKIKPGILTNPIGVENIGLVKKASLERAVFDCFYLFGEYHIDNPSAINKDKLFGIAYQLDKKVLKKIKKLYA